MILQVLDAARDDLIAAYDFYDGREQGIGDYFLACLYADVDLNYIMDTTKLLQTGVTLRPVQLALESALQNWQPAME